jgi:NitT/TauT family transport system substrate-binding protein
VEPGKVKLAADEQGRRTAPDRRIRILRILPSLVAAAVLAASQPSSAATPAAFRIAHSTWVGSGPLHLAAELGYLREQGLTVEFVTIDEKAMQMAGLLAGRVDAVVTAIDAVIPYVRPTTCFRYVLALDESYGGDGLIAKNGIKSLRDLRGRTLAFNEGSISHFWLSTVLQREGMTTEDVHAVNMTPDDAAAAFMAGRVDAAVTWEPHLAAAKRSANGHVLLTSEATPGLLADALVVRCDLLRSRKRDLSILVGGWFRAVDYWNKNPDKATAIMAASIGGYLKDPKDFSAALAGARFFDHARNVKYLGTPDHPGEIGLIIRAANDFWRRQGKLDAAPKWEELVDSEFVR